MGRGGYRLGAGRKKGSKESQPRIRKTNLPVPSNKAKEKYKDITKPLHFQIKSYLSAKNRQLYLKLYRKYEDTLDCLRALRDDLVFRYNYARLAEMEGVEQAKKIANETLEELAKEADKEKKKEEAMRLRMRKKHYPKLARSITELAAEIRQISDLINRIETNKPDGHVNIFNIMLNKEKAKKIEDGLFKMPEEIRKMGESKIVDGEIIEND